MVAWDPQSDVKIVVYTRVLAMLTASSQESYPYHVNKGELTLYITVKPLLSGHLKIDKTKILMTNGSLMKVKSIAECSPWSILQYFLPALSDKS